MMLYSDSVPEAEIFAQSEEDSSWAKRNAGPIAFSGSASR
jgi:hypothetical protein